ncbi:MAG: ABC transporter permease subunit [Psychromonas sp.]
MLINNEFNEQKIQSPLQYSWTLFTKNNFAMVALWGAFVLVLFALFADVLTQHTPYDLHPERLLLPPFWVEGGTIEHIFGTDDLGRDSLASLIQAFRMTFIGAIVITLVTALIGTFIGAAAVLNRGVKSSILHHLLDALLTMPTLLTTFILIVLFGASYENCLLAVTLSLIPQYIRGIFLTIENELNKQYITALRLDGATNYHLLRYGIFPNILEPSVTLLNRIFTMAILEISTLGFLGFGAQLPELELGSLIASKLDLIYLSPWLILIPGLTLFLIIIIFNILTEGIRHSLTEGED